MEQVRLDKWLWAARFFKTRALAKKAIEGGKVHYNGERTRTSKQVQVGAILQVPQGWDVMDIEVIALSDQRRNADHARTLYSETEESKARRAHESELRKMAQQSMRAPQHRPDKKSRREIQRFQRQGFDD
ncbi:Heat shock protein 15 [Halomonadaceae bacterium LMG 33818]|uniref:RNA-binding S4 domain-containing protein n=1 Tax=Cernens ardua TaxID=3402176 RepID=UPI003EDC3656